MRQDDWCCCSRLVSVHSNNHKSPTVVVLSFSPMVEHRHRHRHRRRISKYPYKSMWRKSLAHNTVTPKTIGMPVTKKSWQVWKTIDRLEEILSNANNNNNSSSSSSSNNNKNNTEEPFPMYPASPKLVETITSILQHLAHAHEGKTEWQGLLNKSTLFHEVEESILAIHFLQKEWDQQQQQQVEQQVEQGAHKEVILVDVCCGKGVFSLLASYFFVNGISSSNSTSSSSNNNNNNSNRTIRKIIMLDKDPKLRWDHIHASNDEENSNRPFIETWPRFNLHEMDQVVTRLENELEESNNNNNNATTLALVGIHLCKTLSPTCIGIANLLGSTSCPHLILAPCCLPRVVVQSNHKPDAALEIRQHETLAQRNERLLAKERRASAMVRRNQDNNNKTTIPAGACWKCGEFGHVKAECPSNQSTGKPQLVKPPTVSLQVAGILSTHRPFGTYCELLSTSIQRTSVQVEETGLTNSHMKPKQKIDNKQELNNWNRDRKSMYIVASERAI